MFDAIGKALRQLDDPAIQRTLMSCVAIAIAVFIVLWMAIGYLLSETSIFTIGWLETVIDVLGGLATAVFTWLLFPAVVSGLIGVFLDSVAKAVEARHYPSLPEARGQSVGETIVSGLKFFGVLVLLNLFLLLFLIIPPVFPFVFYAVNGYLLGREYFELVALRRIPEADARALRKQRQGGLFVMGVLIAMLLTVPVVNLLTPIVATAAMVHLFQSWRPQGNVQTGDGMPPKPV